MTAYPSPAPKATLFFSEADSGFSGWFPMHSMARGHQAVIETATNILGRCVRRRLALPLRDDEVHEMSLDLH